MPGGRIGCCLSSVIYPIRQFGKGFGQLGRTERHFNRFVLVERDRWKILAVSGVQESYQRYSRRTEYP